MTDARETIFNVLHWFTNADRAQPAADAILAAMPEIVGAMVKPLEWGEWKSGYCIQTWNRLAFLSEAKTNIGEYRIGRKHQYIKSTDKKVRAFDSEYSSEWYVDAPFCSGLLGPFNGDVAAKQAANDHHRAQVLGALGL